MGTTVLSASRLLDGGPADLEVVGNSSLGAVPNWKKNVT